VSTAHAAKTKATTPNKAARDKKIFFFILLYPNMCRAQHSALLINTSANWLMIVIGVIYIGFICLSSLYIIQSAIGINLKVHSYLPMRILRMKGGRI
jgi:hypothetical protein